MIRKCSSGPTQAAFATTVALLFIVTSIAKADTVILKDGDKLTGTIASMDAGKLTINVLGMAM